MSKDNEYALVSRMNDTGAFEVVAIYFEGGLSGFTKWVDSLPKEIKRVDTGGRVVQMGNIESYDADSKANTIAVFYGARTMVYSWSTGDMAWAYMKSLAEDVPRERKVGRPPKVVQPLQTWKKWSKKVGAAF